MKNIEIFQETKNIVNLTNIIGVLSKTNNQPSNPINLNPKIMKQNSTFLNFQLKAIVITGFLSCFLLFSPISSEAQTSKEYTVSQVAELLADLKGGLFDIYELSTSGGEYVLPGTGSVIDSLGRNAIIRAKAGLLSKPIVSASGTSASSTASIFVIFVPDFVLKLEGIEFNGLNTNTGSQPILVRSTTTALNCSVTIKNCFIHDFNNVAGNGIIRLEATSSSIDIQETTFNNCSGRMLFFNTQDGNSTTQITTVSNKDITLKNCTFSNIVNSVGNANSVIHYKSTSGVWAKGRNATIDHCTFYNISLTSDEVFRFRMMSGLVSITNCIFDQVGLSLSFVNPDLTAPPMVKDYCYLGFAVPPTGTNTITTAPIYTNVATLNFGLTNRSFFVGSDGLTVGDTRYYTSSASISPLLPKAEFHVYPNPVSQFLKLEYKLQSYTLVKMDLYNLNGQFVKNLIVSEFQNTGNYSKSIDISTLENGSYFARLTLGSSSQTIKLVVTK